MMSNCAPPVFSSHRFHYLCFCIKSGIMRSGLKLQALFNRQSVAAAIALLLFLPLLFLNIRADHDWGDDFAQYLAQAENIARFHPMPQTGYVYNEFYPSLGPKAYPPGFPLMISAITGKYGNYIPPYNYLISVILLATTLLTVLFLKRYFGLIPALALSLMVYYNPYVLELKAEVMADIPFAFLFVLFLTMIPDLQQLSFRRKWLHAGVITGVAVSVKTAGFALAAGLVMYTGWQLTMALLDKRAIKNLWKSAADPALSIGAALGIVLLLNLIFMRGASGASSYLNTFSLGSLSETVAMNLYTYTEVLRMFFISIDSRIFWFGFIAGSAAVTFTLTGLIVALRRGPGIAEWVMLAYLGLLLVYPYHNSGFRFLLPLAPLILYYIATAVGVMNPGRGGIVLSVLAAAMMLVTYMPALKELQERTAEIQEGPYAVHAQNAFEQISAITPEDALIVFIKPRALARFTGRNSMAHLPESTPVEVYKQFEAIGPTHFLLYSELPDPALENYIRTNRREIELIWRNQYFRLYRKV